uniref:Uncharacterized protein n=1 Tax=Rhizophora mucronata TaxID=61149 RepID=A0A2P2IY74_RHIMU
MERGSPLIGETNSRYYFKSFDVVERILTW